MIGGLSFLYLFRVRHQGCIVFVYKALLFDYHLQPWSHGHFCQRLLWITEFILFAFVVWRLHVTSFRACDQGSQWCCIGAWRSNCFLSRSWWIATTGKNPLVIALKLTSWLVKSKSSYWQHDTENAHWVFELLARYTKNAAKTRLTD